MGFQGVVGGYMYSRGFQKFMGFQSVPLVPGNFEGSRKFQWIQVSSMGSKEVSGRYKWF
jgi:hypothetical protein